MKKYLKVFMIATLCIGLTFGMGSKARAMEDGAYIVPITFSYTNPDTNQTEDGSSNIALGESMISSMLVKNALVEQVNGKTYVTVGIGMMSNVSNVRVKVQSKRGGSYSHAAATKTGSSSMNGDTCNHYRVLIQSTDGYISPILFIDPMGRDVQFFIGLNMGGAKKGTGIYKSQMIPTATPVPTVKPIETPIETPVATTKPTATPHVTEEPTKEPQTTKTPAVTETPAATKEPVKEEATTAPPSTPAIQKEEVVVVEEAAEEAAEEENRILLIAIIAVSVLGSVALLVMNGRNKKGGRHE